MFLAFLIAPVMQVVNIGTQLTEAFAGLDRTQEVLQNAAKIRIRDATVALGPIAARSILTTLRSPTKPASRCCTT